MVNSKLLRCGLKQMQTLPTSLLVFLLLSLSISACSDENELKTTPEVETGEISEVTSTSATVGGQISNDGNASVSERGVVIGKSTNPTINDIKVTGGNGVGGFSVDLAGLTAATTYHVRAFGTNSVGTSYGVNKTFNTNALLPTLTTTDASGITQTTVTSGGNISNDGGAAITARGVVYGVTAGPTTSNNKTTDGNGSGAFTSNLTGLVAGTKYYVRAYATNSVGTAYGNEISILMLPASIATITTTAVSSITVASAVSGGTITGDGGATVTARGVCWSINQNPTISNNKTSDGNGIGTFNSSLTNLAPSTTYYLRAYATNSVGTAYGPELSFKTSEGLSDIEGNVYGAIAIGTQTWMKENLKVTKYRNGDNIPNEPNIATWPNLTTGAYVYYDNNAAYNGTYGKLYNWYAVMDGRGLCPVGWHLPSDDEWTTLTEYLGGINVAGGKMKTTGTSLWDSPNTGATNESGFSGLPGGFLSSGNSFYSIEFRGSWWSTSEINSIASWSLSLFSDDVAVFRSTTIKYSGLSARCVKD
jgi:uncharacterized protein (TIGR02145 family)